MESWVKSLFLMALAISALEGLLPKGAMKQYLEFLFALTFLAVILQPLQEW